jgi:DNA-binding MarR family transcriptional regulator
MNDATAGSYRLLIAEVYELAGRSVQTSEAIARRHGQTAARWHVMSVLADRDASASAIARRLGQARQSVHRVAADLLAASLLQAIPNPDHQRSPLLRLTETGHRVLEALTDDSARDRADRLTAAGLAPAQLDQARQVLRSLIDALNT